MEKFISDIVSEASLDARIPSGVIDLKNVDHIQVIAERIYDACENEQVVNEFLNSFINEGKYPDRQAFNKEGWLVTFPSKEYRDAALKKGTHSISDPTHGKGGMNLYYKKRGKQKRQTQQAATATDTQQQATQTQQPPSMQAKGTQPASSGGSDKKSSDAQARAKRLAQLTGKKEPTEPAKEPTSQATSTTPASDPSAQAEPSSDAPKPTDAPAIDVPVVEKQPEQYANVSRKFATQKGWREEPYGEWKNAQGETEAVVGLSGEIVPVQNVYREEYKIFAEKNMPKQ